MCYICVLDKEMILLCTMAISSHWKRLHMMQRPLRQLGFGELDLSERQALKSLGLIVLIACSHHDSRATKMF